MTSIEVVPATTLPSLLLRNAAEHPSRVALREKEFGIWLPITWHDYAERVRHFSDGLRELGFGAGDKLAILGDNRPEWVISELAAQVAGGVSMGIYQDSVAEEVRYLIDFTGARFVVAEDQEQVDKLLELRDGLPKLERIVYYDPRGLSGYPSDLLMDFEEVERLGERSGRTAEQMRHAVAELDTDGVAVLSTTSGTTGKPKLAMLTHGNMISMAQSLLEIERMGADDEFVSFLPLAWIGEQMTSVSCALLAGFTVNFPEEPETVQRDIREIGPRTMFSPPRIWENMVSEVQVKIEDTSWLKRRIHDWAMRVGHEWADHFLDDGRAAATGSGPGDSDTAQGPRDNGVPTPSAWMRLRRFVAEWTCHVWLKDKLGLRRLDRGFTGGAALGPDIFRFFHALGVNLKQIYGQTEVAGISCVHRDGHIHTQTVGTALPEIEIRIDDQGEILTRGPSVFVGYYENPKATAETLADGWLRSGDAGYFDQDGQLVVIDRAKDVMTLSDGTRFSPQFLENKLKFSPYIREAVVFGGGDFPFVTSMITVDFGNTGKWAERHHIPYTTFTDLSQKSEVYALVREHVETVNLDLPESARIQRFLLLHKELDADDAELTRTRKVRRGFVAERYREILDALYGDGSGVSIQNEITYQDGRTAVLDTKLHIERLAGEA